MIVAVTGHRPQRLKGQEEEIRKWTRQVLIELKPSAIYDGMAQGADQIVALVAKEMDIPIICCYPYRRKNFCSTENFINENNEIVFTSEKYSKQCYYIRDCFMVDHADILLTFWDGVEAGGAFLTREYAKKRGVPLIEYPGLKEN